MLLREARHLMFMAVCLGLRWGPNKEFRLGEDLLDFVPQSRFRKGKPSLCYPRELRVWRGW